MPVGPASLATLLPQPVHHQLRVKRLTEEILQYQLTYRGSAAVGDPTAYRTPVVLCTTQCGSFVAVVITHASGGPASYTRITTPHGTKIAVSHRAKPKTEREAHTQHVRCTHPLIGGLFRLLVCFDGLVHMFETGLKAHSTAHPASGVVLVIHSRRRVVCICILAHVRTT